MYISLDDQNKKQVSDKEAFAYACSRIRYGCAQEQDTFFYLARICEDMEDFAETLVEWWYAGNWMYQIEV